MGTRSPESELIPGAVVNAFRSGFNSVVGTRSPKSELIPPGEQVLAQGTGPEANQGREEGREPIAGGGTGFQAPQTHGWDWLPVPRPVVAALNQSDGGGYSRRYPPFSFLPPDFWKEGPERPGRPTRTDGGRNTERRSCRSFRSFSRLSPGQGIAEGGIPRKTACPEPTARKDRATAVYHWKCSGRDKGGLALAARLCYTGGAPRPRAERGNSKGAKPQTPGGKPGEKRAATQRPGEAK